MTAASSQVAILMATYNGAEFLPEQLDSLADQTYEDGGVYGFRRY
jgi:glycosyltransferase involved in cell wall biosynthesis